VKDNSGLKDLADEKAMAVWQRTSNYGWWWRSKDGASNNDNKTTIKKCTAAEGKDNNGWQEAMVEQQLWCSGQARAVNGGVQWQLP
jgi:hypothetical protein